MDTKQNDKTKQFTELTDVELNQVTGGDQLTFRVFGINHDINKLCPDDVKDEYGKCPQM